MADREAARAPDPALFSADNGHSSPLRSTGLKPYDIEVQRLKSLRHDKGLIEVSMDALIFSRKPTDDDPGVSCLRIPVDHARTLWLLLKEQLAELDKTQPRSRRSGRA